LFPKALFGRTIPSEKRGRLLGYQQLLGGIGGIFGGFLIKVILAMKFPDVSTNYSILFFFGASFLTVAGFLLFLLKDNSDRVPSQAQHSFFEYIAKLPYYIKNNKRFVTLMITHGLFSFNGLASPLYILFAKNRFHFTEGSVTTLMYFQLIGSLAGGVIWGLLSHNKGNKFTIQVSIVMNMAVAALAAYLALFDTNIFFFLTIVIIFFSGILLGAWLGFTNALFEVVREEDQPVYIAISSTLLFPLSFITFLGGILADWLSFSGVFMLVIIFMIFAFYAATKLKTGEDA
jgi:MFS family permease